MPYDPTYKPDDILAVLDTVKPANLNYISEQVGCSRPTAKTNLLILECQGKVKQLDSLGVKESLWLKL